MSRTPPEARQERDTRFMHRALELAKVAVTKGQTPFGSVVVDGGVA